MGDLLGSADAPILVVDEELLEATTGYPVHRGALASMARRPLSSLTDVVDGATRIVVLEDLVDHTNVGAVFRSAAALGMDAVVLTDRCADPLYRRAIRTSMGAVFTVPWTRVDGPEALREAGFELVALTPAADAVDLRAYRGAPKVALALGIGRRWPVGSVARGGGRPRVHPDGARCRFAERGGGSRGRVLRAGCVRPLACRSCPRTPPPTPRQRSSQRSSRRSTWCSSTSVA